MKPASDTPLLRGLLAVVGLLAAGTLVWYAGPLIAIAGTVPLAGEGERWAAIAALTVLAAAHAAWRAMRAARSNRRLMEGMVAPTAAPLRRRGGDLPPQPPSGVEEPALPTPGEQEVALLGERFERAVGMLKHRRVSGRRPLLAALTGRPYVYELPWYIIIGAPGAGKTTALANSGLEFPLASQLGKKVIRGIGGTRNCDWWFAADAVLIDTAGRYTTHDSHHAADRTAWLGFLNLLTQYRPGRPINGVLLTISVSDLLGADAGQRLAHARALRERIEELHTHLGIRFPIYVLVTKTDLLAGFMEFFADFDKDERAQVWGVTFPYDTELTSDDPLARMASDFAALEKRLNQCLIDRLHAEHDRERRPAVYAFPQQWGVLRETLLAFLQTVFAETRDELRPFVRGVYFTSATQEGTPIDRAIGGLARALGLSSRLVAPARPSGKTFFVTRLLRDVVLAEAGLAGTNLRWQRHRARLRWGLAGATACAAAAATALSWSAYEDSRARVAAVAERVTALGRDVAVARDSAPADLVALLPTLQSLQSLQAETHANGAASASRPSWLSMGLDRGDMLAAAAQDAYEHLLKDAFLPRIAARLEERLRAGSPDHVTRIYEDLKAYLMLFGGKNFDKTALRAFLSADWDATLPTNVGSDDRAALRRHLDHLLAGGEVGAPSQAQPRVVASARSLVASVPLAQRAYSRLKQTDLGNEAVPFSVESAGGPNARRVFVRASGQPLGRGIPGLYSRAVFQQSFHQRTQDVLRQLASEQNWVLGSTDASTPQPASLAPLADEVERLYVADYVRLWDELLNDLRLVPSSTLAASAETTQVLAHADSPLAALLRAAVREVSVGPHPPHSRLPPANATASAEEAVIDPRFDALRRFAASPPAPLDDALALLGRLSTHLSAVDDAVKRKAMPPASDVTRELAATAQRAPSPLQDMLTQLAQTSAAQEFAAMREPLARRMASELTPLCAHAVAGRYPLVRSGREEVSREEFNRMFGAGGVIDGFFQRHLAPYVDTSARPWAYRVMAGTRAEPTESLPQFQRAQWIREAFFHDGGRTLGARLEFRLVELDAGVGQFVLDIDGQALRFGRESKTAQGVYWPGPLGTGRVHLRLVPAAGGSGSDYVFEGPWALFRLFDRVRIDPGPGADHMQLLFDVEGRKARFEVRSAAPLNPLLRQELEQFQCPKRP